MPQFTRAPAKLICCRWSKKIWCGKMY